MIDSTELPVLEAALKLYGGKCIVNSINLEDGEERPTTCLRARAQVRRGGHRADHRRDRHGQERRAQARDRAAPARLRLRHATACRASDLLFDPLTFTICTGNEDDRRLGPRDARGDRARSRSEFPECQIILGLSNICFGLKPAARHVLNSVFLRRGPRSAA